MKRIAYKYYLAERKIMIGYGFTIVFRSETFVSNTYKTICEAKYKLDEFLKNNCYYD